MYSGKLLIERPNGLLLHRSDQSEERKWRDDNSYKFLFASAGAIRYQFPAEDVKLQPGQFLILHPHLRHKQTGYEQEKFLVELPPRFLHEVADSLGIKHTFDIQFALQLQKQPQISRWVHFTKDCLIAEQTESGEQQSPAAALFLDHALVQLAVLLLKLAAGSHAADLQIAHLQKSNPVLYKAIDAIKQSYSEPWTLEEMAKTADMNKYQFAHLFKETIGVSPYSWLQLYRLLRSQELLKRTEKSILEIALECGFSSVTVYHQLFRRIYGVSPGAFRKRYK